MFAAAHDSRNGKYSFIMSKHTRHIFVVKSSRSSWKCEESTTRVRSAQMTFTEEPTCTPMHSNIFSLSSNSVSTGSPSQMSMSWLPVTPHSRHWCNKFFSWIFCISRRPQDKNTIHSQTGDVMKKNKKTYSVTVTIAMTMIPRSPTIHYTRFCHMQSRKPSKCFFFAGSARFLLNIWQLTYHIHAIEVRRLKSFMHFWENILLKCRSPTFVFDNKKSQICTSIAWEQL